MSNNNKNTDEKLNEILDKVDELIQEYDQLNRYLLDTNGTCTCKRDY